MSCRGGGGEVDPREVLHLIYQDKYPDAKIARSLAELDSQLLQVDLEVAGISAPGRGVNVDS